MPAKSKPDESASSEPDAEEDAHAEREPPPKDAVRMAVCYPHVLFRHRVPSAPDITVEGVPIPTELADRIRDAAKQSRVRLEEN